MAKCVKCDGVMDIHYGEWCPMCDKPEPEQCPVFDFFRAAKYIAAHEGYSWAQNDSNNWYRRLLAEIEFPGNDCYINWYVDESNESELYNQFDAGLKKYFGCKDGDEILLNISW